MAKFKAMRDFLNVPQLDIQVGGKKPAEVKKGDVFEIGDTSDLAALPPAENTKANLVISRNMAIFMDNPANKGRLETLDKQLAEDKAQAEAEAKKPKTPTMEELLGAVVALAKEVTELKTPKGK